MLDVSFQCKVVQNLLAPNLTIIVVYFIGAQNLLIFWFVLIILKDAMFLRFL